MLLKLVKLTLVKVVVLQLLEVVLDWLRFVLILLVLILHEIEIASAPPIPIETIKPIRTIVVARIIMLVDSLFFTLSWRQSSPPVVVVSETSPDVPKLNSFSMEV